VSFHHANATWLGWAGLQVSKEEFFQYFTTVYLSASDMTAFKED
jgi:hypothetical protein